jgi:hypothetical protein
MTKHDISHNPEKEPNHKRLNDNFARQEWLVSPTRKWLPKEVVAPQEVIDASLGELNFEFYQFWDTLMDYHETHLFPVSLPDSIQGASPFYFGGHMVEIAQKRIWELSHNGDKSVRDIVIRQTGPNRYEYTFTENYELEIMKKFIQEYTARQESLLNVVDIKDEQVFFETQPGMAVVFDVKESWDDTHAQREDVRFFLNYIADDYDTKVLIAPILRALRRADEWLMLRESLFLRKKFQGKLD